MSNVRRINAALSSLLWSDTSTGRTHDQRSAEATPSPLPAGSQRLQDLGFLALTLPQVEVRRPTQKPRGRALTRTQTAAKRRLARRRVRLEHVNSRVKRGRVGHETNRLRKAGVRDRLMEGCGARHHFRVRFTPWQPRG